MEGWKWKVERHVKVESGQTAQEEAAKIAENITKNVFDVSSPAIKPIPNGEVPLGCCISLHSARKDAGW